MLVIILILKVSPTMLNILLFIIICYKNDKNDYMNKGLMRNSWGFLHRKKSTSSS
jgi:hypothetical protein